jgi:hypothetical protein
MNKNRTVYRRADGKWVNKRDDATKASSVHDTQQEAIEAARQMLEKEGKGELITLVNERQSLSAKELISLPLEKRRQLVAQAFAMAADEDFEIFEAYTEEALDDQG